MLNLNTYLVLLVCLLLFHNIESQSRTNFKVTRFEICKSDSVMKMKGNITTEGDRQYANLDIVNPVVIDENIGGFCDMHTLPTNSTAIPLFTIRERYVCKALNKYLGEFWYDMLRAAQLPVGVCPIPAGRYHLRHVYLDYKKIALQTFPFGKIRFVFNVFDNRHPQDVLLCLLLVVDNRLN